MHRLTVALFFAISLCSSAFPQDRGAIRCDADMQQIPAWTAPGSAHVVEQLSCNQEISIDAFERGYFKVLLDNRSAYVYAKYVRLIRIPEKPAEKAKEFQQPTHGHSTAPTAPLASIVVPSQIQEGTQLYSQKPLTNADVIKLTKSGISIEAIMERLKSSAWNFDTSPQGLLQLHNGSVPDRIIVEIIAYADERKSESQDSRPAGELHQRSSQTMESDSAANDGSVLITPPSSQAAATGQSGTPSAVAAVHIQEHAANTSLGAWSAKSISKPKKIKIHGYVTEVVSQAVFDIEDYRITRDDNFRLEFENSSPEVSFNMEDLRIGTELEIQGLFYADTGELQAQSIKVDMEQFKKLKQTAIINKAPAGITREGSGWKGTFFADGQRITVFPDTQVLFKLTSREKKIIKEEKKRKEKTKFDEDSGIDNLDFEYRPLSSLEEVAPGMIMTYEGYRNVENGTITANRVEFMLNDLEKGEERLWKQIKTNIKPGDANSFKPDELSITGAGKFKLHPSEELQEYVRNLAKPLIPKYLSEVPESDRSRIPFQFFVVSEKEPNAFALPNGTIVVHSGMFAIVENEAQLAAVLAHEIAHSAQEHQWRQMQYHRKKRTLLAIGGAVAAAYGYYDVANITTLVEAAIRNGYSRSLENQADREGLQYMVEAGYDPREAPKLWKQMTKAYGLQLTNFFWSTHENQATRRSYLMNEIRNNYSNLDYSKVHKGDDSSFQAIKQIAQSTADGRRTIKVKY